MILSKLQIRTTRLLQDIHVPMLLHFRKRLKLYTQVIYLFICLLFLFYFQQNFLLNGCRQWHILKKLHRIVGAPTC